MRIVSGMIVLALLCTTVTGCSLFKKNNGDAPTGAAKGGAPPPKFPQDPLLNGPAKTADAAPPQPVTVAKGTSTLAGTVRGADHRPIGNGYVQLVNLEEKNAGSPIDVPIDPNGHFIAQGLKAGDRYKLIARTKLGDKMLAGSDLTRTPNVFVEIVIREDGVTASTPPLPAPPGQGPANANHTRPKNGTAWNAGTDTRPGERNLPATMNVPAPPATKPVGNSGTPGAPAYVPGVADSTFEKNSLPLINIPGPPSKPAYVPPDPLRPPGLPPADARLDTGPARVPSCVLVGKRLESLALKDSRGQVWDYRKQGYGKLVLIDFWGTYCLHCREAMPILDRLHTLYGTRGLEVIGIALESGKDERRETEAVQRFASSMKLHYRQLIGRVGAFDAGKNFKVDSVPTLILLGENGDIIWHHVGRPDTALLNALERTIQTQLNNRAY